MKKYLTDEWMQSWKSRINFSAWIPLDFALREKINTCQKNALPSTCDEIWMYARLPSFVFGQMSNVSVGAPSCVATEQNIANAWGRGGGNLSHMENCTGQNLPLSGMEIFYVNQTWFFVTFKFRGQKKMHEWANKCNPNHWKFYVNSSKSCKKQAKVQNISKSCHPWPSLPSLTLIEY